MLTDLRSLSAAARPLSEGLQNGLRWSPLDFLAPFRARGARDCTRTRKTARTRNTSRHWARGEASANIPQGDAGDASAQSALIYTMLGNALRAGPRPAGIKPGAACEPLTPGFMAPSSPLSSGSGGIEAPAPGAMADTEKIVGYQNKSSTALKRLEAVFISPR